MRRKKKANEESIIVKVSPGSLYGWERQFQEAYMKEIYKFFRDDVINFLYCMVLDESGSDNKMEYKVVERICGINGSLHAKNYLVNF